MDFVDYSFLHFQLVIQFLVDLIPDIDFVFHIFYMFGELNHHPFGFFHQIPVMLRQKLDACFENRYLSIFGIYDLLKFNNFA